MSTDIQATANSLLELARQAERNEQAALEVAHARGRRVTFLRKGFQIHLDAGKLEEAERLKDEIISTMRLKGRVYDDAVRWASKAAEHRLEALHLQTPTLEASN